MIINKKCYDLIFFKVVVIFFNIMFFILYGNFKVRNILGFYDVGEQEVKVCLFEDEIFDFKVMSVYLFMKVLLLLSFCGYLFLQYFRNCIYFCIIWFFIMIMCLVMFLIRDRKQCLVQYYVFVFSFLLQGFKDLIMWEILNLQLFLV